MRIEIPTDAMEVEIDPTPQKEGLELENIDLAENQFLGIVQVSYGYWWVCCQCVSLQLEV